MESAQTSRIGGHSGKTPQQPLQAAFAEWSTRQLQQVEQALSNWVGANTPEPLAQTMRYAVLDGGKRMRPLLVLAASEALEGHALAAMRAACAVELIHAYSLVHDDMPCMDNDVLRRGKPTVHVRFGEADALLAGDALQALAFELLTPEDEQQIPATMQAELCRLLARAAGGEGMAGGQAIDLASVGIRLTREQLQRMHQLKTGALLQASVNMGAVCGQTTATVRAALHQYGAAIGLAFQVVDDVLDVVADSGTLGKTAGKDAANGKPTYVSLLGLQAAQSYAQQLHQEALQALDASGLPPNRTTHLRALADALVQRAS